MGGCLGGRAPSDNNLRLASEDGCLQLSGPARSEAYVRRLACRAPLALWGVGRIATPHAFGTFLAEKYISSGRRGRRPLQYKFAK